jgi:hypothetical protein
LQKLDMCVVARRGDAFDFDEMLHQQTGIWSLE